MISYLKTVQGDDNLLYLEKTISRGDDQESLEIKRVELNEYMKKNNFENKKIELSNLIRDWIESNIDEYSKEGFEAEGFDYNPKMSSHLLSRGYNRLCDIEDMSKVAPVWRDAILEVCEYFMKKMSFPGVPYFSLKNREYMKDNKDKYLILFNARKKIKDIDGSEDYLLELTDRLLAKHHKSKSLTDLLNDDWAENFGSKITFEKFLELRTWFSDNKDVIGRQDIIHYIKEFLKSEKNYINEDGKFNELFEEKIAVFFEKGVGWNYFNERDVANGAMRFLKMSPYYQTRVAKIVEREMSTCYGS